MKIVDLPYESRFLKVKFELLRWVQIVKDDETTGRLVASNFAKVNAFCRKGSHRSIIIEVGAAERQIFVELHFLWFILFEMIASAS